MEQATRQLAVANGLPVQWHFAEEKAAEATQALFKQEGIKGIEVIFSP